MKQTLAIVICLCLVITLFSIPSFAEPVVEEVIRQDNPEIVEPEGGFWAFVFGWALGKFVFDPLWEELVEISEEVNDYFYALQRSTQLEYEARRLFLEMYPNGYVSSSGSYIDEYVYPVPCAPIAY